MTFELLDFDLEGEALKVALDMLAEGAELGV